MAYINTQTLTYPVSYEQVVAAFPNTSFPPGASFNAPAPYVEIVDSAKPPYDRVTQQVIEDAPAKIAGVWTQKWKVIEIFATPEEKDAAIAADLAANKENLIKQIDRDVDALYAAAIGNRASEYLQAETDATAFKAAGYTGTVPASVQSWATATGKSAQWAADDTLAAATAWRTAQESIRANRLRCKESARVATTQTEINSVKAQWSTFLSSIKSQLGI